MTFESPIWLLLLPAFVLVGWIWRALRLWQPLRALSLLLIVLLLARPRAVMQKDGMDLWVLLDRSESTEDRIDRGVREWQGLLEKGKRSRDDTLHFVDFAADVVPQDANAGGAFTGNRRLTRTALALENLIALRDPEKPARALMFTDGFSTEPLTGIADKLLRENMPLDLRILPQPPGGDWRIRRLRLPLRAQVSEPFLIEAEITGPSDGEVPLTILRDGASVLETKVTLTRGRGFARFTDRMATTGAYRYEARIAPEGDSHPGNNRAESFIEITGGPRLLLLTAYPDDPLPAALGPQFQVEVVTDLGGLDASRLTGCRGVIFNNVPAWEIPAPFLSALDFFVSGQGGGFLMAGGKRSFGAGGYFQSAVDALLPVSMELKQDQRKLMSAMSIVLDRSGSMAAPVAGGRTKMDLANDGSAQAIEFLGYLDSVSVFAVDSEAHEMVPHQKIGSESNKQDMIDTARRITSGGGGIFVYNGLKAGWKAIRDSSAGVRHIILFADAADAEQPGDGPGADYKTLLEEVTKAGATVSVIALGTDRDTDAEFLKDVAERGKGRIFFTDRPEDVPGLFTAETLAVTRNTFITDPTGALASGAWGEISPAPMAWLAQVDGYNLSYLRPWASQALLSKDEYTAPLVSWGQRGAGRTAAVSFALGGEYSDATRAWPRYGDFLQTMGRWLMGDALPPGIGLRRDLTGTALTLDLLYDGDWEKTFAAAPPRILLASGQRADVRREATWQRLAPGHYSTVIDLEEGEILRGAVVVGKHTLPFGPVTAGSSAEWAFDPARVEELRQVSAQSGGVELLDLSAAWTAPPVREAADLRRYLLPVALVLLLLDALATRLGWKMPVLAMPRRAPAAKAVKPSRPVPALTVAAVEETKPVPAKGTELPEVPADEAAQQRKSRFARAKR